MSNLFVSSVTLFLGAGLFVLANGMLMTAVSLVSRQEQFSSMSTAWVLAAYSIGMTLGAWLQGRMVRRFGHIRVFAGMSALLVNAALLLAAWRHPVVWFALRLVVGFSVAGLFVVLESWVSERATPSTRGVLLAMYTIVIQGALACGQFVVPLFSLQSNGLFLLIAALYGLALIPVVFTPVCQPSLPRETTMRLGVLWKLTPTGFVGSIVAGIVAGSLMSLGPLFASSLLASQSDVATFLMVLLLSGLLLQWPVGFASDRLGRDVVLIALAVLLVVVAVVGCVLPLSSFGTLLVLGAALGSIGFVLYPLNLALANDLVTREQMVAMTGTILIVFGFGATVGPFAGTLLLSWFGPQGWLLWLAMAGAGLAVFAILRLQTRAPVSLSAQGEFVHVTLPSSLGSHELEPWFNPQLSFAFMEDEGGLHEFFEMGPLEGAMPREEANESLGFQVHGGFRAISVIAAYDDASGVIDGI
jgi:MFS family permease